MYYRNVLLVVTLLALAWTGILLCIPGVQGDNSSEEEFECANGKFVPEMVRCDAYDDCGDRSDETNCTRCQNNYDHTFKCDSGECIKGTAMCNLYDDCEDGSDENNCLNHTCADSTDFLCKSGECVSSHQRCNGEEECSDKSDEESCIECDKSGRGKQSHFFKCKSSQMCIHANKLCNSIEDCPDGSDEDHVTCQNLKCMEWEFQCGTGNCIGNYERCNGRSDCYDDSDELNCSICKSKRLFKCEGEDRCILEEQVCDTEPDCVDGSDESEMTCRNFTCSTSAFQCESGQCLSSGYNPHLEGDVLCNGHNDCNDETDKYDEIINCTHCSRKAFKCGSGECVHKYKLCNSIRECSDGSDENEINCPDGSTPPVWNTFWREEFISSNQNVSLKYVTEDLAVYFDKSVPPSVTWPFSTLSQAWKYAKEAYGPTQSFSDPGSQFLYVVLGKRKKDYELMHAIPFRCWESGYRNLMDVGLRERNGWDTENFANFERLISGLGLIVRIVEEGAYNFASIRTCGHDIDKIVLYDIYVHLKGQRSPDVMRWRDTQFSRRHEQAKANCFRDLFLPVYQTHGGASVLKNYFQIFRENWPKKKGVYSESHFTYKPFMFKQLNVGELVHFWSGAAGVDLRYLANSTFKWNDAFEKQFSKAQTQFPDIKYIENEAGHGGSYTGILLCSIILLLIGIFAAVLKLSWPRISKRYTLLVNRYW